MFRIQVVATCVSAWLLVLACPAGLQSEERRGDAREREAFFDAMREFLPHKELFDLVDHDVIRREIKLSDADAELIDENVSKSFEAMHAIRKANEGQDVDVDELKRQIHQALDPLNQSSYAILAKADFKRLLGIYVQARGYRALLNDQVAGHIGLQGAELKQFRRTRNESWQLIMEDLREDMKRAIRNAPPNLPPSRDAFAKLYQQAEEKLDLKLSQELTAKQKADLETLKGAKFDLPKRPFNFRPPPSRNRGRGGGRGPGERGPEPERVSESETRECKPDDDTSAPASRETVLALPSPRN